jgi:thiopeptide-type bacteriocin biosynthesis protein
MLKPFSFVLVRSPLQPLQYAYNFSSPADPLFKEGLYLSSPEFLNELEKREQLSHKEKEKLDRSMAKYMIRSCMRCTPYGTFAGFFEAAITDGATSIRLNGSDAHNRHIRIDMSYIEKIVQFVMTLPEVNQHVRYYPNNSLYEIGDNYRFAEYTVKEEMRKYHLTAVAKTDYLQLILERARKGATIKELVAVLVENEIADEEESSEFIRDLYQSQVIVPDLGPSITGNDPLAQVIQQLEPIESLDELVNNLKQIHQLLQNPGNGTNYYKEIAVMLENLGLGIKINKNVFQTDLRLSTDSAIVNKDIIGTICKQVEELMVFSRMHANKELDNFKTKFLNKYEDAEVPLAIALDADLGIGYGGFHDENSGGSEFINDLGTMGPGIQDSDFDHIKRYSLVKYDEYLRSGKEHIEIKESELDAFKKNAEQFRHPVSMFLQGHLLKKEDGSGNDNFTFGLNSFFGPSAANLLGRFAYASKSLEDGIKEILRQEESENPDAIYAEIAHQPQARIGNILLRPVLRNYEIPYVGKSGLPEEQHIDLNDLFVSIKAGRVELRSHKHNRQVIPRLTTAHNYSTQSLPFYKFLCDLQLQQVALPRVWDWGNLVILKRLPRVVYKNLILQKAQWKIEKKDISKLPEKREDYLSFARALREKTGMPRLVLFVQYDNELLIDLEDERGVDLFLHYITKYESLQLEEFLFSENNCFVENTRGEGFTNELIIPMYRMKKTEQELIKSVQVKNQVQHPVVKRKFQLNSNWLYFKIYCGSKTAEKLLTQLVLPYVRQGLDKQLFDRFFFIRYKDEFSHFRIRFYNEDINKQPIVLTTFLSIFEEALDKGIINKITTDAYNREIERYGDDMIEEAEMLFFNDSVSTLKLLDLLEDDEGMQYRVFMAMRGIDMLLEDFKLTAAGKRQLLKQLAVSFHAEAGGSETLLKLINNKYRIYQKKVFSFLDSTQDEINEVEEAIELFRQRSAANEPVVQSILSKLDGDAARLFHLLGSYIHMFMNRFFVAQQRKYELVAYHFMERYYISRLAILKGSEKKVLVDRIE